LSIIGFIVIVGWLQGRHLLEMFTIGVRYIQSFIRIKKKENSKTKLHIELFIFLLSSVKVAENRNLMIDSCRSYCNCK
jgi:hypothetical protein